MNVNERLAVALGWKRCEGARGVCSFNGECGLLINPETGRHDVPDDYERSMDALVRDVVPVLRERGYDQMSFVWDTGNSDPAEDVLATIEGLDESGKILKTRGSGHSPAAALSEAAAIVLEAMK